MNIENVTQKYSGYLSKISKAYQTGEIKNYTTLTLSLLVVAFFAFFAIRPTLITIASLNREIKDQKIVAEKLEDKIQDLAEAQKEYLILKPKLYLIDEALPQSSQVSLFLGQIEVLALEKNLELVSVQVGQVTVKGKEVSLSKKEGISSGFPVKLSLSGSYENLKEFLKELENQRRATILKELVLVAKKDKALSEVSLRTEIEVFYLPTKDKT
ncbi:MAG: type 4a pilus biogenesis protein PilO [Candidatus Pacebacteria bacterium]|nr:type 4a pilus biogenesis protein PilO [Candidatus Paceibacterota bacterium]